MLRNYVWPICKFSYFDIAKIPSIGSRNVATYIPRRALLYVPGDDLKKVDKALQTDADCITIDCEDGVAMNKKAQARLNIRELLDKGRPERKRKYDLAVRVNDVNTQFIEDDLGMILTGKALPDTILLPKVDEVDHLRLFSDILNKFLQERNIKIQLIMGIESAISLINSSDICKAAQEMSQNCKFTPVALLFGSDDFCASVGARRSDAGLEVLYARQKIIVVAKAFNLQAIDMVYIKYQDLEGLQKQAEDGARLGFTGKQIIHPGQISATQKAFLPTEEQVKWASGLLKAFHKHQQYGKGAFSYEGNMIDMPTMRQAQNVMDLINAIMIREPQ